MLFILFVEFFAFVVADTLDKKVPVEMIHLVLDRNRQKPIGLELLALAEAVLILKRYKLGSFYVLVISRYAKAAFLIDYLALFA